MISLNRLPAMVPAIRGALSPGACLCLALIRIFFLLRGTIISMHRQSLIGKCGLRGKICFNKLSVGPEGASCWRHNLPLPACQTALGRSAGARQSGCRPRQHGTSAIDFCEFPQQWKISLPVAPNGSGGWKAIGQCITAKRSAMQQRHNATLRSSVRLRLFPLAYKTWERYRPKSSSRV